MALYPIDPDVRRISRRFAGSSLAFPKLLAAVERAEGNILKAVQCSEKDTADRDAALDVTARSACHAMADFIYQHHAEEFVKTWAMRWAPVGAKNDPTGLNKNWPLNVLRFWLGQS